MKKKVKIPLIVIVIISPFILYGLHSVKKAEATISDGKILVGDGTGPYLDGPQHVIIRLSENAFELSTYDYTSQGGFGDRYVFLERFHFIRVPFLRQLPLPPQGCPLSPQAPVP